MAMTVVNWIERAAENGAVISRDQGAERNRARASILQKRILQRRLGAQEVRDLSR